MKLREVRCIQAKQCELRAHEEDGRSVIDGYAARFNVLSEDLFFGREKIREGAFKRSLNNNGNEVVALWGHLEEYPLARRSAGNLEVSEDENGLKAEIHPDDTSYARDLITSIDSGTVQHMSFGFRTIEDAWETVDGEMVRELIEVQLFDVSPVTTPAYPQTDVAVRSLLHHEGAEDRDIEEFSALSHKLRAGALTGKEFRSMLDPFVSELRKRREDSGTNPHDSRKPHEGTQKRRLQLRDHLRDGLPL